MSADPQFARHRFHFLDALRGVAAVLIVFWHAPWYLNLRSGHATFLAVDFFFCLSGFVIAFSYEERLRCGMTRLSFMRSRLVRLYPTYLAGLALGAAPFVVGHAWPITPLDHAARAVSILLLEVILLPNLAVWPGGILFPINFPSWSIFFELTANGAFALLAKGRRLGGTLLGTAYTASLVSFVGIAVAHRTLDFGWSNEPWQICGGLARVALSFVSGILILRVYRRHARPWFGPVISRFLILFLIAALVVLLQTPFSQLRSLPAELMTVVLLLPSIVYLGARCSAGAMGQKIFSVAGEISYPLYLLHAPLISVLELTAIKRWILSHHAFQPLVMPMVVLVTGSLSVLALRFYDRPVRALLGGQGGVAARN